jgi:urea transport system permease protein
MLAFFRNEMGFGGNNGLTDFKDMLGFDLQADSTRIGLFASAPALALGYLACRWIVTSKLGRVAVAIRDAEPGALHRLPGGPGQARHLDLLGDAGGLAGALYVPQVGIINPGEFSPLNSIELVVWVAIGGRATLYGAVVIGRPRGQLRQDLLHGAFPEAWLFASAACSCWSPCSCRAASLRAREPRPGRARTPRPVAGPALPSVAGGPAPHR